MYKWLAFLSFPLLAQTLQPGDYLGTTQVGATVLRIALHLTQNEDGSWGGTIDSLDQGAFGLAIRDFKIDGTAVRFNRFEGKLSEDGTAIEGRLKQGTLDLAVVFRKVEKIETLNRRQMPQPPYPYIEQEVAFVNDVHRVQLVGTLTLPKNLARPVPAAVLVSGAGPQDRDSTMYGHKPFLVLADDLTRRGFAVLRMDDRGVGKSTGRPGMASLEELAQDAALAIEFLRSRKEIDPKAIGVIGHGEGGYIAPMAAVMNDAAFVILLGAPGVPGDELLYEQGRAVMRAAKASDKLVERQEQLQHTLFNSVLNEGDPAKLEARLRKAVAKFKASLEPGEFASVPDFDQQLETQIRGLMVPELQSVIRYDPGQVLAGLKCPVLALNGALDTQVPAKQNLPAIAAALGKGSLADYEIVSLPRLNHLLQTALTGAPGEYSSIEETIAPVVLDTIGAWLSRHFVGALGAAVPAPRLIM